MKKLLAFAGLSAIAISFLATPLTSEAFGGRMGRGQGMNYDPARHEAMKTALENKDYDAWKSLVAQAPNSGQKLLQIITEDNFDKFAEAKLLMIRGQSMLKNIGLSRGLWKTNQTN